MFRLTTDNFCSTFLKHFDELNLEILNVSSVLCTLCVTGLCFCLPIHIGAPMATLASPLCRAAPASAVIATAIWTCPYLAAAIQSQASVFTAVKATEEWAVAFAQKVTMEMPSLPKTVNVSRRNEKQLSDTKTWPQELWCVAKVNASFLKLYGRD